jgi:hypothetical protein
MFDLYPISQTIAQAAMDLGGSEIRWYKAIFCPYVRDNGKPCYDEDRGTVYIECPICGGEGVIYASPRTVRGIYTDNSNRYSQDRSGGFIKGEKSLALPIELDIRLLKERSSQNARRLLRDKFELLGRCCRPDGSREVREVLYLKNDPVRPEISSGSIFQRVEVANNY